MEHFKKSPASNQPRQLPCSAYPSTEEEVRESTFHPTAPAHTLFCDLPSTGDGALKYSPASKQHRQTPYSASFSPQDNEHFYNFRLPHVTVHIPSTPPPRTTYKSLWSSQSF